MQRNKAGKISFYAWDTVANQPFLGGQATLTAYVRIDGGVLSALADTGALEINATNAPGAYEFDYTAGESNGEHLLFSCKSSTAGVVIDPIIVYTIPANISDMVESLNSMIEDDGSGNDRFKATAMTQGLGFTSSDRTTIGQTKAKTDLIPAGGFPTNFSAMSILAGGQVAANLTYAGGSVLSATFLSNWTGFWDNASVANLATVDVLFDAIGNVQIDIDDLLDTRLTSTRAGYLDKLNISGNVASSAEVVAIQNNTRVVRVVPESIERPDTGTITYRIELLLYDTLGNMEVPDSAPTIALVNQAGTDRSARLDSTTMANVSAGRYRAVYTASAADAMEQLVWTFTVIEGGATRLYGNQSLIVDTTAVDFTTTDRTMLVTLHDTRLTAGRAAALDNLDELNSDILAAANAAHTEATVASQTAGEALVIVDALRTDYTTVRAGKLDFLDASVASRMATFTVPASFAGADFTRLDAAITTRMATFTVPASFAAANFALLDAAVSTRMVTFALPANFDDLVINGTGQVETSNPGSAPTVAQIRTEMDTNSTKLDVAVGSRMATFAVPPSFAAANFAHLDAAVSTRMATFSLPANFDDMIISLTGQVETSNPGSAPTVQQIRTEMDTNSTKLDVAVGSRMATFNLPTNFSAMVISVSGQVEASNSNAPTVEQIRTEMDTNSTKLIAVKARTDLIPTAGFPSNFHLMTISGTGGVIADNAGEGGINTVDISENDFSLTESD